MRIFLFKKYDRIKKDLGKFDGMHYDHKNLV